MTRQGCIFCGNSPTTKEHLVSAWASDFLAKSKPPPSAPDKVVVAQHERWSEGAEEDVSQKWLNKNGPNFQVKCVCASCNQGWMSEIEEATGPIMKPMIRGQAVTLDTSDQEMLSTWLGLKAIIAQHSVPPANPALEWTEAFASDHRPPTTWQIRIGRYTGERPLLLGQTSLDATATLIHTLIPVARKHPWFLFLVQLGAFVGQVVGLHQPTRFLRPPRRLIQIWPHPLLRAESSDVARIEAIGWPPESGLDDSDLVKAVRDPEEPK